MPPDRRAERVIPEATLVVAVVAVSTSAILVRWSAAPSLVKAFYRVAFTVLLLAPWAVVRHRDAYSSIGRRDLLVASTAGVALAVHFASWFESLRWTSVAASVTLVQVQALIVPIVAWALLDERVTRRTAIGIIVAFVGVAAMTIPGGSLAGVRPLYGNLLALLGAATMAGYVLVGRSLRQRIALVPYVMVVYVTCALVLLAMTFANGDPVSPSAYPPREWLLFLGMAVGPGLFGHTVLNWALEHLESSAVSVSLLGEPVGSALLAALLLSEVPGPGTAVGGSLVLFGVYLAVRSRG